MSLPLRYSSKHLVEYLCNCGEYIDLNLLYFCQLCSKFNCPYCISHIIDQYFCKKCFETLVWTDVKKSGYFCRQCFECPRCNHTLNSLCNIENEREEGKNFLPSLICFHCQWFTQNFKLDDFHVSRSNAPISSSECVNFTNALIVFFKGKTEKEIRDDKRKKTISREFLLSGRNTVNNRMNKLGFSFFTRAHNGNSSSVMSKSNVSADVTTTDSVLIGQDCTSKPLRNFDGIFQQFYSHNFILGDSTSLSQRISDPLLQPNLSSKLRPKRLKIASKRFKRCRYCDHILSKPDLNVSAIRFKIQHFANLLVPSFKILSDEQTFFETSSHVPILLTNPSIYSMSIEIFVIESLGVDIILSSNVVILSGKEDEHQVDLSLVCDEKLTNISKSIINNAVRFYIDAKHGAEKPIQFNFLIKYQLINQDKDVPPINLAKHDKSNSKTKERFNSHNLRIIFL